MTDRLPAHPLVRLWRYALGHRRTTLLATLCSVLNKFFDLAPPVLIGMAVDIVVRREASFLADMGIVAPRRQILVLAVLTFVIWALESAFEYAYAVLWRNIQALPNGYDTTVGERGQKLSGGQRQRLSIARALLKDPAILMLDEATSAVDNETEAAIQRALAHLSRGRTTVIVAHRLSTIRQADTIHVLNHGQLVESGGHDELIARAGVYAGLWRVQTGVAGR